MAATGGRWGAAELLSQVLAGQPIAIDYRMEKGSGGWKVYDVTIEGISLVENYRNTFNNEIQRSGVDGLIKALTDKNKALAAHVLGYVGVDSDGLSGVERFARDLSGAGGAGLITPDLTPDSADQWIAAADAHDLHAGVLRGALLELEDHADATPDAAGGSRASRGRGGCPGRADTHAP